MSSEEMSSRSSSKPSGKRTNKPVQGGIIPLPSDYKLRPAESSYPGALSTPQVSTELPVIKPSQAKVRAEAKVKKGLSEFFSRMAGKVINWSTKTLVPALLSAALFPILGPVGVAVGAAVGAAAVTKSIQAATEELKALSPHMHESTVNKLIKPLQGKQLDEDELREVIRKVLSDRQANEDLKELFIDILPTIQKAARSTTINISGPVQGLIVGDQNTITQTFKRFSSRFDV